MRLHGSLFADDGDLRVTEAPTGDHPVWVQVGSLTLHLTRDQATKLCFDLLATVPSVEMTAHLAESIVDRETAR